MEKLTLKGGKLTSTFTRVEEDAEEEEQEDPKRSNWPELSPADREAAQRGTGLPWWYPIQPRNRMDPMFERMFIDLGRTARDRLLDFYRTMALLGRMGLALKHDEEADPEAADVDLDAIDAQRQRAQDAYDRYIEAKAKVYDLRVGYLNGATFVGPEVEMVFMRIDNALPNRVDELTSENDGRLKAAYHAARTAVQAKRRQTDAAYTALFWTDVTIAIIGIAILLASAMAVFNAAAKKALAKGLSEAAARKVAATYAVAHLATAAASAVAVATALPAVLRGAGLDEAEVRAGLALMRGFATIVGARAMLKQRPPSNPVGRHTLPDKLPEGKGLGVPPRPRVSAPRTTTPRRFSETRVSWTATRPRGTGYTYEVIQRTDINWQRVRTSIDGDERAIGLTNAEAARRFGLAPELDDGFFATLHHLGQDARGPLVEASRRYHGVDRPGHGSIHSNYGKNQPHPTRPVDRRAFGIDTREYWRWRAPRE